MLTLRCKSKEIFSSQGARSNLAAVTSPQTLPTPSTTTGGRSRRMPTKNISIGKSRLCGPQIESLAREEVARRVSRPREAAAPLLWLALHELTLMLAEISGDKLNKASVHASQGRRRTRRWSPFAMPTLSKPQTSIARTPMTTLEVGQRRAWSAVAGLRSATRWPWMARAPMKERRVCTQPLKKMRGDSEIVQEAEEAEVARLLGEDEAAVAAEEALEAVTVIQEEELVDPKPLGQVKVAEAMVEATVASRAVETTMTDRVAMDQAVTASTMTTINEYQTKVPTSAARLRNQTSIRLQGLSPALMEEGTKARRQQDLLVEEQVAIGIK